MIVLEPVAVTAATLVSSTVPETEYPAWAVGTTYAAGARVIRAHRIRESVIAGNTGNAPETAPDKWLDIGPTNRWAMFDQAAGPQTTRAGQIEVELAPAIPLAAIGIVDARAAEVRVRVFTGGVAIHDLLLPGGGTRIVSGLPTPAGQRIVVSVNPVGGAASIGQLLVGSTYDLGETQTGPSVAINDYSRRETDDFGVTTVVERSWAKRMSARTRLSSAAVDGVQGLMDRLLSRPALWAASRDDALLHVYGFARDFAIDFTIGETSFSSLTIEGLPAAGSIDSAADPAVEGTSDLRVIAPLVITDAILASSTIPALSDHAAWASGTIYGLGDRVTVATEHLIYESAVANNQGNAPAGSPERWFVVGPTSRWAMFDQALGTFSSAAAAITVVLTPPAPVDAVALFDVGGASVRVEVQDAGAASAFDQIRAGGGQQIWTGLPKPVGQRIIVTVQPQVGVAQIGTLVIGTPVGLGRTETSPQVALTDYALKTTDDFGNTNVVPRGTAKRLGVRSLIATERANDVLLRMAALRATPAVWMAADDYQALVLYGFYRDFSLTVSERTTLSAFTIEGLTKAVPSPPPVAPPADGKSAYSFILSNDVHQVPATNGGAVTSYAGAATELQVLYGDDDVTSSFVPVALVAGDGRNPQGLVLTGAYPSFAVTSGFDANEETASFLFRVTGTGVHAGVTLDKVFSLSKSKAGANGEPPPLITLSADKMFAKYDGTDAYIGGAIRFTAIRQNIPGPNTFFRIIRVSDGSVLSADTSDAFGAGYGGAYAGSGGDKLVMTAGAVASTINAYGTFRVEAYRDDYAVTDSVTIAKVKDGANGASSYALLLSNESHTVPADEAGNVTSYAGASTDVRVLYGAQDVTSLFSLDYPSNPQGLSTNESAFPTIVVTGGLDAGEDSAALTIRMTGTGAHAGMSLSRVFSLSKSRAGAGATAPPLLTVSASSQVLHLNADGTLPPGTPPFVFTATRQNYAGPIDWAADPSHNLTLGGGGVAGNTLTVTAARMREVLLYNRDTVGIGLNQKLVLYGGGLADTVTIVGVLDGAAGADAIVGALTTTIWTVKAGSDGVTKPGQLNQYSALKVKRGATDITGDCAVALTPSDSGQITASYSGGSIVLSKADVAGYVDVAVTYTGVPVAGSPFRIQIYRPTDAPPPQGSTSQTGQVYTAPGSTSYAGATDQTVVLKANGAGAVNFSAALQYVPEQPSNQSTRSYTAAASPVWRAPGGSWSYAGETVGSFATNRGGFEPEVNEGALSIAGASITGLTAGALYEFGLAVRRSAGNSPATALYGSFTVSQ